MFERRLKTLLSIVLCFALVLLLRAAWLQVVQGSEFRQKAAETGRRSSPVETTRGPILDFKGRVIAQDSPCIDAAVDYRAINIDAKESQEWLRAQARQRLVNRGALQGDRAERTKLIDAEVERVKEDIALLWRTLAKVSDKTAEDIEQIKFDIRRKVEMRRRVVWYAKYRQAVKQHEEREPSPAWYSWLIDDTQQAPQLDSFKVTVAEQTDSHVILRAIDNETYLKLDKLRDRAPGLELKKSVHRFYPYHDVACHLIGHLSPVDRDDLSKNPEVLKARTDDMRRYGYTDLIGRGGVERLAEPMLRGGRGQIVRQIGKDGIIENIAPVTGQDVRITIDMELQQRVQEAFMRYKEFDEPGKEGQDRRVQEIPVHEMHGAAVVIDVPTGQVRAMVSYPTFDLNQFDQLYGTLSKDLINQPLLNRATQSALEPGSTIKPLVGLGAITAAVARVDERIECTGYLVIGGRQLREGRCWVATKFAHLLGGNVAHHPVPSSAPHPDGFLTFGDALERSCNVYFETLADRMRLEGLAHWYKQFGLGQHTEIGIAESEGRVPGKDPVGNPRSAAWFTGIGQSQVLATPLQMANATATIARRGTWIRPHLLTSESADVARRDLKLSPAALDEALDGMIRVVNGPAGTGKILHDKAVLIAGKTGTAQAARFNLILRDEQDKVIRNAEGKIARQYFRPSTATEPNAAMPWYRGSGASGEELGHAWMIGFAPAHDPKIAFAVMVEYGGSGGRDAGPIAKSILAACAEQGYLGKK